MQSARHSNAILLSANTWLVWGWRDDVDGEHWRTSVCVNNSPFFLSSAAEERCRRSKAWVRWANQRGYTQKAQHKYQNGWIFLILPRNYTKEKVIVELLWWWRPNCKQGLKAEVHFYQKSKGRRGKGKNTHTGSMIGFPWFSKGCPAGTGRGGVSMAGGREGQGARKGNGVRGHRLPSPPCFVQNLLGYFGFFCLDEKWERLLPNIHSVYLYTWILVYFTWISLIHFIVISNIRFCMLDVVICRHT